MAYSLKFITSFLAQWFEYTAINWLVDVDRLQVFWRFGCCFSIHVSFTPCEFVPKLSSSLKPGYRASLSPACVNQRSVFPLGVGVGLWWDRKSFGPVKYEEKFVGGTSFSCIFLSDPRSCWLSTVLNVSNSDCHLYLQDGSRVRVEHTTVENTKH